MCPKMFFFIKDLLLVPEMAILEHFGETVVKNLYGLSGKKWKMIQNTKF